MSRRLMLVLALLTFASLALAGEGPPSPAPAVPGLRYRLEPVVEGVYCATASRVPYHVSNAVVIVGKEAVAVVDPGAGPDEARVLLAAIRERTALPVRYVIDTHFHFDHAFGNAAFAGALVVAQEATRALLDPAAPRGRTLAENLDALPKRSEDLRQKAEREADAGQRAALVRQAEALEAYHEELEGLRPTPPVLTFRESLTLWRGGREVRLLHLGRGHTAGDLVVYLPKERVVCTGDLFNGYLGYMGDAYVDEWPDTLERLAALDFDTAIPGHGAPFRGKEAIAPVQACLRDLWRQAQALKRVGLSAEEAAARIDLRAHASRFPRLAKVGFEVSALRRIYERIDERAAAGGR